MLDSYVPSDEQTERWRQSLQANPIGPRIDALRQISSCASVHGLTADVVALAASADDEVRMWAAEALETAVQPQPSEQMVLIQLLKSSSDSELSYWTVTMLGRLGQHASAAADVLSDCLRESEFLPARERAVWALTQIGPDARVAIPVLRAASESGPPRLRRMAEEAIGRISETTPTAGSSEEAA